MSASSKPTDRDDCPECDGTGLTLCPGLGLVECPECPPMAPRAGNTQAPLVSPQAPRQTHKFHPAEVRWGVPEAEA